jgi:hypothetical protein
LRRRSPAPAFDIGITTLKRIIPLKGGRYFSALRINNQLTVNAINAAAENFRTFNRTIDSVTEFNSNAAKAWNSFLTAQQQQFLHKE